MTKLTYPEYGAVVDLHTEIQRRFKGTDHAEKIDWLDLRRSEKEDCTFPLPVRFEWEGTGAAYKLELSEKEDLADADICISPKPYIEVTNLKIGHQYFWRVNGSDVSVFSTADTAPRWLEAGGLSNVRDMGGWKTADGRRIKQGLIYRGCEFDTHHTITKEGIHTLHDGLGIRTDLDLRGEAVGKVFKSALGDDVEFIHIPAKAYSEFMEEEQKPVCKALFDVLADSAKYPIYFHCWGGADRTGTLAFMLEAVLGVSQADMFTDYELTSLSIWGERSRNSELFTSLLDALDGYPGNNIHEKVASYLASCGINTDTLAAVRNNLLE